MWYRMIAFTALFYDTWPPAMRVPVGVQICTDFGIEALLFRVAVQLGRFNLFHLALANIFGDFLLL